MSESEARNTEYLEEVTLQRPSVVEPIERGVLLKREVMPSSAEDRKEFLMAVCFRQQLYSPNTSSFFRIYENVLRMTSNRAQLFETVLLRNGVQRINLCNETMKLPKIHNLHRLKAVRLRVSVSTCVFFCPKKDYKLSVLKSNK